MTISAFSQNFFNNSFASMKVSEGVVFEYSCEHIEEVWVKYTFSSLELWSKFSIHWSQSSIAFPAMDVSKARNETKPETKW